MLKTFNFKKTALLVASSAAVLGMHMNSTAQTATLNLTAQIVTATCALTITPATGGTSQTGGTYSLDLGSFVQNNISNTAINGGTVSGSTKGIVFALTDGSGGACTSTQRWDLGMDVSNLTVVTATNNRTFITSQSISGVTTAAGLGVTFFSGVGATAAPNASTAVALTNVSSPYGVLIAGSTSGALASERIALNAQLGRPAATAIGAGAFYATIPLNLVYR